MDQRSEPPSAGPLPLAARFWEGRRLLYNIVLTAIGIVWFSLGWRALPGPVTLTDVGALAGLALLANVCYCAGYVIDIGMQSVLKPAQCERCRRWLWLAGVLAATLVESYWVNDEILAGP